MSEKLELSKFGKTESQLAAFTHCCKHKWTYSSKTFAGLRELMWPLENYTKNSLIPSITNGHICDDEGRLILSLPQRFR